MRRLSPALATLLVSACSTPNTDHMIAATYVHEIRVRRPPAEQAGPEADPGGLDYERTPAPNEAFDCEMPETLLKDVNIRAAWNCIVDTQLAIQKAAPEQKIPSEAEYQIVLEQQPELAIDPDTKIACLKATLPKIPVPREIVFQAEAHENSCYAARLQVEAGRVLDIKLPGKKTYLKIRFPLEKPPKTEAEMRRLVLSWALAPLFDRDNPGQFKAKIVPDHLCKKCMGKRELYNPARDVPPVFWPEKALTPAK